MRPGGAMLPIHPDDLPSMLGKVIHLSWARKGCQWTLVSIEDDKIHLVTPKTGKPFIAQAKDARYTRKHQGKGIINAKLREEGKL